MLIRRTNLYCNEIFFCCSRLSHFLSLSLSLGNTRLIGLLSHYRDRLRSQGDEEHDEELEYLMQIIDSPFMNDYLHGKITQENAALFNEVTSEIISALEDQDKDVQLSPETQRKRHLKRRASLRALKLAVTPQSSPVIQTKMPRAKYNLPKNNSVDVPLLQSVTAALSSRENSRESTPARTLSPSLSPPVAIATSPNQRNIDHIYISPYTGKVEKPIEDRLDSPIGDDFFANSPQTLIERTSTPHSSDTDFSRKNSTASILSETSQLTVMTASMSEDIKTPDMRSAEGSFQDLTTDIPSLPSSHQVVNKGGLPPTLPSYNEVLNSRRKARSFERLPSQELSVRNPLYSPYSTSIINGGLPPYYTSGGPMTNGTPTQNIPTNLSRDPGHVMTIQLQKGDRGLGFSITRPRTQNKEGKIFIQDIQPGGVAERGGLQKGDQLLSINGQNLQGHKLPTAVALLQQAHGLVELILLRSENNSNNVAATPILPAVKPVSQYSYVTNMTPPPATPPITQPPRIKVRERYHVKYTYIVSTQICIINKCTCSR